MNRSAYGARLARLLRHVVDEGAFDAKAVRDGRVTVTDLSRSHPVGLARVDAHPEIVFKGGAPPGDGIAAIEAELAAYRWLNASPETASLAPVPVLEAANGAAVVTHWVEDAVSLQDAIASGTHSREALLGELGRILGVLHRTRRELSRFTARRPWILGIPAGGTPPIAIGNDKAVELIEAIKQSAPLMSAIGTLDRGWTSRAMIHGDVKFDNVLVVHGRMLLLDWELAGPGAPVWDLAGVVDGLLVPLCADEHRDPIDMMLVARLAAPAVAAHREVAGSELAPSPPTLGAAAAVRLAQSAVQLAAMSYEYGEAAEVAPRVLAGAVELASRISRSATATAECVV